jgi:lipopolysaccharide exporter
VAESAAGGIRWTLLGFASNRVLTFATTIVLARLLNPADFGLMALAILVIGVLGVFGDLGFGAALVVRPDLGREEQRTVLSVTVGAGAVIAVLAASLSPLAAVVFDEPRLRAIVPVLAINSLASGLGWFYETILQRELQFRARFVARILQAVAYASAAVVLAAVGAGVWSIVVGTMIGTAVYSVTLLSLAPYRVRPGFDRRVARDVYRSGRGFVVQGGTAFLRQNVDYLAVGQAGGAPALGYYSLAYRLAELPKVALADPLANVTFPSFAQMRARGEDPAGPFLATLRTLALLTFLIGALLSGAADPFVRLVYGDRWLPMIGPLSVFGMWAAIRPVEVTMGWLLNSLGQAGPLARLGLITLVPLVPGIFVAAHEGGIEAVAWVLLAEMVVTTVVVVELLRRHARLARGRVWSALRPGLVAFPVAWVAARGIAATADGAPDAVGLAASAAAGLAAYLATVLVLDASALRAARDQVVRVVRGRRT